MKFIYYNFIKNIIIISKKKIIVKFIIFSLLSFFIQNLIYNNYFKPKQYEVLKRIEALNEQEFIITQISCSVDLFFYISICEDFYTSLYGSQNIIKNLNKNLRILNFIEKASSKNEDEKIRALEIDSKIKKYNEIYEKILNKLQIEYIVNTNKVDLETLNEISKIKKNFNSNFTDKVSFKFFYLTYKKIVNNENLHKQIGLDFYKEEKDGKLINNDMIIGLVTNQLEDLKKNKIFQTSRVDLTITIFLLILFINYSFIFTKDLVRIIFKIKKNNFRTHSKDNN